MAGGVIRILKAPRAPGYLVINGYRYTLEDGGGILKCTSARESWPGSQVTGGVTLSGFACTVDSATGALHMATDGGTSLVVLGRKYTMQGGQVEAKEEHKKAAATDNILVPPPPTALPFPEEAVAGAEAEAEAGSGAQRHRPLRSIVVSGSAAVEVSGWPALARDRVAITTSGTASLSSSHGAAGSLAVPTLSLTASGTSAVTLDSRCAISGRLSVATSGTANVRLSAYQAGAGGTADVTSSGVSSVDIDLFGERAPDSVRIESSGTASVRIHPRASTSAAVERLTIDASGMSAVSAPLSASEVTVACSGTSKVSGFQALQRATCSASGMSRIQGRSTTGCKVSRKTGHGCGSCALEQTHPG